MPISDYDGDHEMQKNSFFNLLDWEIETVFDVPSVISYVRYAIPGFH